MIQIYKEIFKEKIDSLILLLTSVEIEDSELKKNEKGKRSRKAS